LRHDIDHIMADTPWATINNIHFNFQIGLAELLADKFGVEDLQEHLCARTDISWVEFNLGEQTMEGAQREPVKTAC